MKLFSQFHRTTAGQSLPPSSPVTANPGRPDAPNRADSNCVFQVEAKRMRSLTSGENSYRPLHRTGRHAVGMIIVLALLESDATAASWTNRYNGPGNGSDIARAIAVDANNNVYVTGSSDGGSSYADCLTKAFTSEGVPLWTHRYNGPGNDSDGASAIAVDGSGNVIVAGSSTGSGLNSDYLTIAYTGQGVPLWTNRYDGPAAAYDGAGAIAVDGSNNVYVTGTSYNSSGGRDCATIAYNAVGVPLWTNRYDSPGSREDWGVAITADASGNVYVAAHASGIGVQSDYATLAYTSEGSVRWIRHYKGTVDAYDSPRAIAVDDQGNVYVTGVSEGDGNKWDCLTLAYSGSGSPLWTNRYDGLGNDYDEANAIAVDDQGNVYVAGMSIGGTGSRDYVTIAYTSGGIPLWTNLYNGSGNGSDYALAIALDGRGNVVVTGYSPGSGSDRDWATITYTSGGVPLATNRYNGPGNDWDSAGAIKADGDGNVYVAGFSTGTTTDYDFTTIRYDAIVQPIPLHIYTAADHAVLSWTGTGFKLQSAPDANGPFTNIPAATSPYTNLLTGPQRFFRLSSE